MSTRNEPLKGTFGNCRACDTPLERDGFTMADGCLCNSPRGVNHGLVPKAVCTCKACDPQQTGASRFRPAGELLDDNRRSKSPNPRATHA